MEEKMYQCRVYKEGNCDDHNCRQNKPHLKDDDCDFRGSHCQECVPVESVSIQSTVKENLTVQSDEGLLEKIIEKLPRMHVDNRITDRWCKASLAREIIELCNANHKEETEKLCDDFRFTMKEIQRILWERVRTVLNNYSDSMTLNSNEKVYYINGRSVETLIQQMKEVEVKKGEVSK
jgi:hypothetical protein